VCFLCRRRRPLPLLLYVFSSSSSPSAQPLQIKCNGSVVSGCYVEMAMICGVVPVATARVDFTGLAFEFWVVVWGRSVGWFW
jgi:hypothetical protein